MISKKSAEYILKTYHTFLEAIAKRKDLSSPGYNAIQHIFNAVSAIKDEIAYKPSIENISDNPHEALEELMGSEWRKKVFSYLADDEDDKDQYIDLITDLQDPYLEVKAGDIPHLDNPQTVPLKHKDSSVVGNEFKNALHLFLQDPGESNRRELIRSASEIYLMKIQQDGLDADKYTLFINEFLAIHLKDLTVNKQQNDSLAKLVHELSQSEGQENIAAFHVLNHAHILYFQPQIDNPPSDSYFKRHPLLRDILIGLGVGLLVAGLIAATVATMGAAFPALGVTLAGLAIAGGTLAGTLGIGASIIAAFILFSVLIGRIFRTPNNLDEKNVSMEEPNYPKISPGLCTLSQESERTLISNQSPENASEKGKTVKADPEGDSTIDYTLDEADNEDQKGLSP